MVTFALLFSFTFSSCSHSDTDCR